MRFPCNLRGYELESRNTSGGGIWRDTGSVKERIQDQNLRDDQAPNIPEVASRSPGREQRGDEFLYRHL
ncbi:hypothetical protein BC936DRAFT_142613 [Jimgerdemannia flammicorona]|uniref:Uncharacterized protein n=1 Tax=Jimgerdemannia flammicorona TaxID=994334 RepID=A0A433A057_9FUNG|nr:hypothetical protein BC936DRAFT_142613 [Jimgerdemannia flammicorona]